ncbi:MAG: Re/Si-specific NAD(P)(+) transhydrogenase subunit alpha [Bacteroidales bacterium]|nr:Re/Si-specific NAD(P)(+) transhydrogenase subunit alpha [Bacteroidales bacterium]
MIIGILKVELPERRVAMLPETIAALCKMNVEVLVEDGAGLTAFASNVAYEVAGALLVSKKEVMEKAGMIIKINPPSQEEMDQLKEGQLFLAAFYPLFNKDLVHALASKKVTSFSMDIVPRTTRAQAMDILSSMATISGYKSVLTAALLLPKFFPMFMTAAGTIKPAKLLILGAGVAGLQAVATARKLGAVVEVFDVRAAVKEEVMGLGAKFVEVEGAIDDKAAGGYAVEQTEDFKKKQAQAIHDHAVKSDVVICTAQIPGRKAPLLLTKDTVEGMMPGSVIIDLAASTGGNCALTKDNEVVEHNGVTIVGESSFPVSMPSDASKMFGKNIFNFLKLMYNSKDEFNLNWDDDLILGTCVTRDGEVVNERVKAIMNA